ncbi:hypothetical protein M231_04872 [Tremella mesenterica]|uniref:MARVEL domain-containing protein n=1 Tax=Tremella mesenterica TaxID=5217 RepID=A0A4Q1BJI7_TREME|nr:hypothetical protein M231_04872 [Tremella mesenterica]
MVSISERGVRLSHSILYGLTLLASIIALAISAALVKYYNDNGYPPAHHEAYKARIRILLVASVWTVVFGLIFLIGFNTIGRHVAMGILTHLVPTAIGFILFLIGVSSLTALTDKVDCGNSGQSFKRCDIVKGLVVISWIDTIFLFLSLAFIITLAFIARGWSGVHRSTLYIE